MEISTRNMPKVSKNIVMIASFSALTFVSTTTIFPAEALAATNEPQQQLAEQIQTLKTGFYEETGLELELPEAEISHEYLAKLAAEAERKKKEEEARKAAEEAERASESNNFQPVTRNIPQGVGAEGLVNAARAQIGVGQDCTDMVQNALAAIGMFERRDQGGYDLGPMAFAQFGQHIPASEARSGDIMMREGHVMIYTGDGTNHSGVHGGWNGNQTLETNYDSNPYDYSIIVRIP